MYYNYVQKRNNGQAKIEMIVMTVIRFVSIEKHTGDNTVELLTVELLMCFLSGKGVNAIPAGWGSCAGLCRVLKY